MFVLRSTMDAAVAKERQASRDDMLNVAHHYGAALVRTEALQREMSAWIANKADNITPEQAAQMFYAQNDSWQAAFFNVMQAQVLAHHEALPPARPGEFRQSAGVPAGEGQWWHMARLLDRDGFDTIEAMYEHAKSHREKDAS